MILYTVSNIISRWQSTDTRSIMLLNLYGKSHIKPFIMDVKDALSYQIIGTKRK